MSYRNRRQSIYLQRNSSPGNGGCGGGSASAPPAEAVPPPDLKSMRSYKGYEFVTFQPVEIRPASSEAEPPSTGEEWRCPEDVSDVCVDLVELEPDWVCSVKAVEPVTESEMRHALHMHVDRRCCYATGAVTDMTVLERKEASIVRYSLESVCQRRQLCWAFEPYVEEEEENESPYESSPPDDPWTISVPQVHELELLAATSPEQAVSGAADQLFQDRCVEVTVPGTVSVHSCHVCAGVGRKRCAACAGSGSARCERCEGAGYFGPEHHKLARAFADTGIGTGSDYCWRCRGRGRIRCDRCLGSGMTTCVGCASSGQVKCFIRMIVTIINHHHAVVIRDGTAAEIDFRLLKLADGPIVLEQLAREPEWPSPAVAEGVIGRQSRRLVQLHQDRFLGRGRLMLQRHRVRLIPAARAHCLWRGRRFRFYVFGSEPLRQCFTRNYPRRCSGCCFCCHLL